MNLHADCGLGGRAHTHTQSHTCTYTHTQTQTHHHSYVHKKSTPTFPSLRCVDLARDILDPPLKPPSSSLQPPHLINADSQLTQARITNLFHFSLHTTNDPSVLRYLSLSPLSKDTSEFISKPGAGANAAALMRRKMNIVVVLFIVLKGTATHQELSRRLYLEVNSPMWTYCQPV